MNEIIRILIHRDGLSEAEAEERVEEVKEEINEAIASGDYELVEDIVASELGLEMDYIFDLIDF